ncbi:hypothetical protein JTE90_025520 [Oedothorax gibbosus]|uniref:Uncharacterized protein n=1 Tax=Oedothorax gibbosus TaxID=931172 RepID=A0AAV6TVT8_9ARAC|nr:hypothetical protein JTE90_025520 [Oedothorax gibbosus]
MSNPTPIMTLHSIPPKEQLAILTNPPAESIINRDAVIQLLSVANQYVATHNSYFLADDPTTSRSRQKYIEMLSIQDATIKFLGKLSSEEYIKAYRHSQVPSTNSNDGQTAGAELPCTVVPPGDGPRTPKPRPPQEGISAKELVVNPFHPDSSAPSIEDCNNFSLSPLDCTRLLYIVYILITAILFALCELESRLASTPLP